MTERESGFITCLTGSFGSAAEMESFVQSEPGFLDSANQFIEVRLDLLNLIDDSVRDFVTKHREHILVCCRSRQDGGRWSRSEPERLELLAGFAALGPAFVDVELSSWMRGGGQSINRACRGGCRVMVSVHEFGSSGFFESLAARLNSTGALAVKLAGVTRDAGDLMALSAAGRMLSAPVRCVVGMGAAGPVTRMRPGDFNSTFTFASAAPGLETAEGQPDLKTLQAWRFRESAALQPVALIGGWQVAGSPGPNVLNRLFAKDNLGFQYIALPCGDWKQAVGAIRHFGISRFAVTMPFKMQPCQEWPDAVVDRWVELTGVTNTVILDGERAVLKNTDAAGAAHLFDRLGGIAGRSLLVLGGGATARSVAAAATESGATVTVAARTAVAVQKGWPASIPVARFTGWERRGEGLHDVVVNTTPLGGDGRATPLDAAGLRAVLAAVDVVIPATGQTAFVSEARRHKLSFAAGLDFWCAQAPFQLDAFTGRDYQADSVVSAAAEAGHRVEGMMALSRDRLPGADLDPVCLSVPGSKSITQRYLMLAALSGQPCRIVHPSSATDCTELQAALGMLGVRFGRTSDSIDVYPAAFPSDPGKVISTGQGGTTFRFMAAMSLVCGFDLRLRPEGTMTGRPMEAMWDALAAMGVMVSHADGVYTFSRIESQSEAGRVDGLPVAGVSVDGRVSSQFASALLLAGQALPGGLEVRITGGSVSRPYIDMTIQSLQRFGATVVGSGDVILVQPGSPGRGRRFDVEYDASLAAFWDAASKVFGRSIEIVNRPAAGATMQGDAAFPDLAEVLSREEDVEIDLSGTPDLLPPLVILALFRKHRARFGGIAHVRAKESDRLHVLAAGLRKIGAVIDEFDDALVIHPSSLRGPAVLDPRGDHRMAMVFGILSLRVPGLKILDCECVNKSYPAFWQDLDKVRN